MLLKWVANLGHKSNSVGLVRGLGHGQDIRACPWINGASSTWLTCLTPGLAQGRAAAIFYSVSLAFFMRF